MKVAGTLLLVSLPVMITYKVARTLRPTSAQKHLQEHSSLLKKLLSPSSKELVLLANDLLRQKELNAYWLLPMSTQNHCLLPLSASKGLSRGFQGWNGDGSTWFPYSYKW